MLVDRIGTGLLVAGVVGIFAAGLAAEPTVVTETEATQENAEAVRDYVLHTGDDELIRNLETANTHPSRRRATSAPASPTTTAAATAACSSTPTALRRGWSLDQSQEPNSVYRVP